MKLWIGNIDPEADDVAITEFLVKYCGAKVGALAHEQGDGSRPAVIADFPGAAAEELQNYQRRLHGMFWRGRTINVSVM